MNPAVPMAAHARRHIRWLAFGLAILAALPYLNSLSGPWLLDDVALIARNPFVHRPSLWWRLWTGDYWASTGAVSGLYRPLPMMSYGVTWALAGGWTLPYHATNLLLHMSCAVMLFYGFLRFSSPHAAAAATAVFALHPVHAEVVANIVGRTELLLAAGMLAALHGIGWGDDGRRVAGAMLAVAGTACMVFSKETGLALTALVFVILARRGWAGSGAARAGATATAVAVAIVAAVHVAMRLAFAGSHTLAARPPNALAWLSLSLSAAGKSAQLLVLPWHQQAVWPLPGADGPPAGFIVLGIVVCAAVTIAVVVRRRLSPLARLSLAVAVLSALPLLHIVPNVIWVWERGLYVPGMALAGFLAATVDAVGAASVRRMVLGLMLIAAGVGGVRAAQMSRLYSDDLLFHEYQWRAQPRDAGAALNLSESLRRRKRTEEAVAMRLTAYALAPMRGPVVMAVTGYLLETGRREEASRILESAAATALEFHTAAQGTQGYQVLSDFAKQLGLDEASKAFSARARGEEPLRANAEKSR
jgi:hypothetical protein